MIFRTVAALLAVIALAATAYGLPPAEARKLALEEFKQGGQLFERREFNAAVVHFTLAYDLYADPAYLFNVAVCYERLERWADAVRYYERCQAESKDPDLTARARAAREVAAAALAASQAVVTLTTTPPGALATVASPPAEATCETPCHVRVDAGHVTVRLVLGGATRRVERDLSAGETWEVDALLLDPSSVRGALRVRVDVPGAAVSLDGAPVAAGAVLLVAAGEHALVVARQGFQPFEQLVEVVAGQETEVDVHLVPGRPGEAQRTAGWVTLGTGGAALAAGIVFGALALGRLGDAESFASRGSSTPAEQEELTSLRDGAHRFAVVADVSFGLAAAGVATGLILWLTAPEEAP